MEPKRKRDGKASGEEFVCSIVSDQPWAEAFTSLRYHSCHLDLIMYFSTHILFLPAESPKESSSDKGGKVEHHDDRRQDKCS
jgi:hypothetical protein